MSKYDIIKNLSFETSKKAAENISYRLNRWVAEETIPTHQSEDLKACIADFYAEIDKEAFINENLTGWECGLCQIIDITNEDVCKLLPFLMTAYIFNFPQNEFVSCYLKQLEKNQKPYNPTDNWFLGIEDSNDIDDLDDTELVGIGKLLNKNMPKSSRTKATLSRMTKRFRFPETAHCFNEKLGFSPEKFYIMPKNRANKMRQHIDQYHKKVPSRIKGPYIIWDYEIGDKNFTYAFIIEVLFTWDYILSKYINNTKKEGKETSFKCSPAFLLCVVLFCEELNLDIEIESIKKLLNEHSCDKIQAAYRERILDLLESKQHFYDRKEIFG